MTAPYRRAKVVGAVYAASRSEADREAFRMEKIVMFHANEA
jgi:hypothetical protein